MAPTVGARYLNESMHAAMDLFCSGRLLSNSQSPNPNLTSNSFGLAQATCSRAAARSASTPSPYPSSYSYCGVNANDMYYHGGNGEWGNIVRGCLTRMDQFEIAPHTAHLFCYDVATERVQSFWDTARGYGAALTEAALSFTRSAWETASQSAKTALERWLPW